ncbi:MAG: hypothetical protein KKA45_02785 [Alphaproteobacteria bacterium]|jgi:hypothetical protein|nr:hypothetical protein [Alphaproteobacteria bacterium]
MVLFHISYSYRDLIGFGIILLVFAGPVVAATLTSFRIHRRGWWLALPALLFIGGWCGAWVLSPPSRDGDDLSLVARLSLCMALGGWCGGVAHLLVLAIAGPHRQTLRIDEVF